jgi:type IV secretory pathway VirB3-like protein
VNPKLSREFGTTGPHTAVIDSRLFAPTDWVALFGGMIDRMVDGGRPRAGIGCFGTLVGLFVLAAVVVAVVFVGVIALAIVAVLVVIGLFVLAVDRIALALSPKRRDRRSHQHGMFIWRSGEFRSGQVIDPKVIDTTATLDEPRSREAGPEGSE